MILFADAFIVFVFIKRNEHISFLFSFGLTPVHLAAMRGQLSIIKHLERHGCDLNCKDNKNRTPLDLAEANRQVEVTNYLKSQTMIYKAKTFVEQHVPNLTGALRREDLQAMRNEGRDVRGYIVQHRMYTLLEFVCIVFEPTCAHARWAHMRRFASVCLSVTD